MIAVKSGYYFALMPIIYVVDLKIDILPTDILLDIGNEEHKVLYKGATFKDSQTIDHIIDSRNFKTRKIDDYKIKK